MPIVIARFCQRCGRAVVAAALLKALLVSAPGNADELADFQAAVERALDRYHVAMSVLETGSQEQTAAEVSRLRQAWQSIVERHGALRPAAPVGDADSGATFMQIDMRLVGVLLVIGLGNRDAARAALAPIEETLIRLQAGSTPPR